MVNDLVNLMLRPLRAVDIEDVVGAAIGEHHDDIEELNRGQLSAGQTTDGAEIKPFYRPITVRIKKLKGQPSDRVTLKDEGHFYRGIRARSAGRADTVISSTDPKTKELVEKYTTRIFGLSVASKEQLSVRLRPTIQDKYRQALQ